MYRINSETLLRSVSFLLNDAAIEALGARNGIDNIEQCLTEWLKAISNLICCKVVIRSNGAIELKYKPAGSSRQG